MATTPPSESLEMTRAVPQPVNANTASRHSIRPLRNGGMGAPFDLKNVAPGSPRFGAAAISTKTAPRQARLSAPLALGDLQLVVDLLDAGGGLGPLARGPALVRVAARPFELDGAPRRLHLDRQPRQGLVPAQPCPDAGLQPGALAHAVPVAAQARTAVRGQGFGPGAEVLA